MPAEQNNGASCQNAKTDSAAKETHSQTKLINNVFHTITNVPSQKWRSLMQSLAQARVS
jgi:hypothetical protein